MTPLFNALQSIHVKFIDPDEIDQIERKIAQARDSLQGMDRYYRARDLKLARAVQFTKEGRVFVHLNKKSDPLMGEGHMKKVHFAIDVDTGEKLASASTSKLQDEERPFQREIKALKAVSGKEGWVQLVASIRYPTKAASEESTEKGRLVLEYCNGGDLFHTLQRGSLTSLEIKLVFETLVRSMAELHDLGYIHGDIASKNIFLIENEFGDIVGAKISDVGGMVRADTKDGYKKQVMFTLNTCAPEFVPYATALCKGDFSAMLKTPTNLTQAYDVWCMGAVCYDLLDIIDGKMPFSSPTSSKAATLAKLRILHEAPPEAPLPPLSDTPSLFEVAKWLLRRNPTERLTTQELCERLPTILFDV